MFELMSGGGAGRGQRAAWPVLVSTLAHAAGLAAIAIVPILYATDTLPEVPAMMAFVAAPPPPPPPPPPPAPPAATAPAAKRVPTLGEFAAPVEAPSRIEPEAGIVRGFESGVPGGVEGGVPGGVVGGIVGGLPDDVPPPPPPAPTSAPIVRVGGSVQPPALVTQAAPVYPELAVRARVQGTVILEAVVDEDGRVKDVRVLRSIPLLDDAALDAVRQWRYAPLRLNGIPQPFMLSVTVSFRIPETAEGR